MFRSSAASAKGGMGGEGNSSESESDWDTTVDFPTPRHATTGDNAAHDSDNDDFPAQPTSKTRASLSVTDKATRDKDAARDRDLYSGRLENNNPPASSRSSSKIPTSASGVRLSLFDSGTRNVSPTPQYSAGFPDAVKNNTDSNKRTPSPLPSVGRDHRGQRDEISPTPKIPASMDVPMSSWNDSDAEQQTLHELRATLKKEKTREMQNEAARKQLQGDGDLSLATEHNSRPREKQRQEKEGQQLAITNQERKTGVTGLPPHVLQNEKDFSENAARLGANVPYKPFVIKNPDGTRFFYYFSEGNMSFYEVEEEGSEAVMPKVAEKVEGYIRRGWQEFFGVLRVLTSILTFLMIEALSYIANHIARPLLLGVIMTTGNRLIKPLLAGIFSVLLQPIIIFLWNLVSGLRHVTQPLIDIFGAIVTKLATLLQAFRLVDVNLGLEYLHNRRVLNDGGGGGVVVGKYNSEIV